MKPKLKIFCFALFLLLVSASPLSAQGGDNLRFEHLTVEDGLSNSAVMFILQDADGFMWFGTQDGLNKYDGYKITVYRHNDDDPYSLSSNTVMSGYQTRDGALWFGTDPGGLNRYDKATNQFTSYRYEATNPNSISNDSIWAIYEDSRGILWLGTRDGLNRFDPETGQFKTYKPDSANPRALSHKFVLRIFEDSTGTLWVGTRSGLNRFDPSTDDFTVYKPDPANPHSLSSEQAWSITEDSQKTVWIGTRGGGLNRYDRQRDQFTAYLNDPANPHSLNDNNVWNVLEDSHGTLWVATERGGVSEFDRQTGQFTAYRSDPNNPLSLNNNDIFWLYEDQAGTLWLGSRKQGVNKLYPGLQRFSLYRHIPENPASLSSNYVNGMLVDGAGVLWIGTQGGGLNKFDRAEGQMTYYLNDPESPQSVAVNDIYFLYQDEAGILWLGTQGGGLNRFDPATGTSTAYKDDPNNPDDLSSNFITSVVPAGNGKLWVGTLGFGLDLFDVATGRAVHYRHNPNDPNSLSEDTIYVMEKDQAGKLWIGTGRGGLSIFDPDTRQFTNYQKETGGLSDNAVFCILFDPAGHAWLGTQGGLNRFDPVTRTFEAYNTKNGLPNDSVYGILSDWQGNLWLSTGKGLSKFNPQTRTFRNFDVQDGLQSNQFNQFSYYRSQTGELFFGGPNGLTAFYPDQIVDNVYLPPVVLTDFQLFNQSVEIGKPPLALPINQTTQLTLNHDQSVFSFEFAALNYQISAKNLYQYKMEGFDKDWSPPNDKRLATYTNLDPGQYTFMVKAANNDGVWNDVPKTVTLTILPPWWQTIWFRTVAMLAVIGSVVAGSQWRVRRMHAYNRSLEATVAQRTAQLRESEEKYRNVSEQANDGIAIIQDGHLEYANPQLAAFLGHSIQTLATVPFEMLITPDQRAQVMDWHQKRLQREPVPARYETAILHKDGHPLDVEINAGVMEYRGRPAVLIVVRDMTEHKGFERALQEAKEKAEAANQAKSVFLTNMSHELRTPLNSILGYAQILKLDSQLASTHREQLTTIEQSGHHLLGLINEVLDLSKIEAGKVDLHPTGIDLVAFLRSIREIVDIRAKNKGLDFEVDFDPALPAGIWGDEQRLRQVLINLLGNAVKFTEAGHITFKVENLSDPVTGLSGEAPARLRFTVTDTGVGIAPKDHERIFDPFEQAGEAREAAGGTGLGLAISRNLLHLMGGTMHLSSDIGHGSCFWFDLTVPVIGRPQEILPVKTRYIRYDNGRSVDLLVVDDNPQNRRMLVDMLLPLGFKVGQAGNGVEALALLKTGQPRFQAVITDIRMPELDGYGLIEQIRRAGDLENLVIIVASASVLAEDRQKCLKMGANAFIPKPISIDQLLDTLQNVLQLEWCYGEAEAAQAALPLPSPAEVTLPPDTLAHLNALAAIGDIRGLRGQALILQQNEALKPVGLALETLTKEFDLDKIQALLNKYR